MDNVPRAGRVADLDAARALAAWDDDRIGSDVLVT
jgi:hypothetical protein